MTRGRVAVPALAVADVLLVVDLAGHGGILALRSSRSLPNCLRQRKTPRFAGLSCLNHLIIEQRLSRFEPSDVARGGQQRL
jgi:hypothetical protein